MFCVKKGILISNVLDPLSKDPIDLKYVYERLFKENHYQAFETRTIKDENLIRYFNELRPDNITVTYYVTGDLSRNGISLSSADETNRKKALEYCKQELLIAKKTNCTYLGVGSGAIESNALLNLEKFVESLEELIVFVNKNKLNIKFAIEPLDQYAHKKNVIGSLDMTLRFLNKMEAKGFDEKNFIITWDSAHVALNEDDFEESIKLLAKYIYKVHFANAILDKTDKMYGDYHIDFKTGFMTIECAKEILSYCARYINHPIEASCEIREKNKEHCWILEKETFDFLESAMK